MPKKKLTYTFVDGYQPQNKRVEFLDTVIPGFILRITEAGTKTFSFRYRYKGKNKRYTIGKYPAISLGDARAKAKKMRAEVDEQKDPAYLKQIEKKKPIEKNVEDLARRFIKHHLPKLKGSTRISYKNRIESEIVPAFGNIRLKDLDRVAIIEWLEEIAIERNHPTHSNRCRAILSSMLSFAMDKGLIDYNVMKTVKPVAKETSRDRVYSDSEIRGIWMAFNDQNEPVQSALKVLLMLGQRLGETLRMRWDQIDNVWSIPLEQTKGGRAHYVPLNENVMAVIEGLRPLTGGSNYVFESWIKHGHHMTHIAESAGRVGELSGVDDFRIHDLRRTAASNMARLGTDRTVLGKVLNHKGLSGDSAITAIYDRYSYLEEKREALAVWEIVLEYIVSKELNVARLYKTIPNKKQCSSIIDKIVTDPEYQDECLKKLIHLAENENAIAGRIGA